MMPDDPALDRLRRFRAAIPADGVIDAASGLTTDDLDAILAAASRPPVHDVPSVPPLDPPHWLRAIGRVAVVVIIVLVFVMVWRITPD